MTIGTTTWNRHQQLSVPTPSSQSTPAKSSATRPSPEVAVRWTIRSKFLLVHSLHLLILHSSSLQTAHKSSCDIYIHRLFMISNANSQLSIRRFTIGDHDKRLRQLRPVVTKPYVVHCERSRLKRSFKSKYTRAQCAIYRLQVVYVTLNLLVSCDNKK